MIEEIKTFFSDNSMMIILAAVSMIAIVAIFMFRNNGKNIELENLLAKHDLQNAHVDTPTHDLEGMDNLNMVCDLANGVCHPHNITQEQEQQLADVPPHMEHSEQ
jgi:hypothetical protein